MCLAFAAGAQQPADSSGYKVSQNMRGGIDTAKVATTPTDTLPKNSPVTLSKAERTAIADSLNKIKKHSPKKATIMSALLPGLGQVYNRQWWKVPIVYAGFAGVIYGIAFNSKYFNDYRSAYKIRLTQPPGSDPYYGKYTDANLLDLQQFYRKNRDLCYIIFAGVYVLNILDANVSAHLFDFDVSDDLSMHIRPSILTTGGGQTIPTLSLSLRFK